MPKIKSGSDRLFMTVQGISRLKHVVDHVGSGKHGPASIIERDPYTYSREHVDSPLVLADLYANEIRKFHPDMASKVKVSAKEVDPVSTSKPFVVYDNLFAFHSKMFVVTIHLLPQKRDISSSFILSALGLTHNRVASLDAGSEIHLPDGIFMCERPDSLSHFSGTTNLDVGNLDEGFTIPSQPIHPPIVGVATPKDVRDALVEMGIKISDAMSFSSSVIHVPDENAFILSVDFNPHPLRLEKAM